MTMKHWTLTDGNFFTGCPFKYNLTYPKNPKQTDCLRSIFQQFWNQMQLHLRFTMTGVSFIFSSRENWKLKMKMQLKEIKHYTHHHLLLLYPDWFWMKTFLLKRFSPQLRASSFHNFFCTLWKQIFIFIFLHKWKKLTMKHCGGIYQSMILMSDRPRA